jgi:hypothetical protein
LGDGEGAIKLHGLSQGMFAIVLLSRCPHQAGVDHQKIAGPIELKDFNGPAYHICKTRLFASRLNLIRIRQFGLAKDAEKFGTPPIRYRLKFRLRAHQVKTVPTDFQQQITLVATLAAFGLR